MQWAKDREPGEANSDNPEADVRQGGTLVLPIGRNFFSPRETTIKRWQVADTLTWVRGAHKVKGGFDFQFDDILNFFPGNFSGVYTFSTLAAFNGGCPTGPGERYVQAFAGRRDDRRDDATRTSRSTRSSCRTSGGCGPTLTVNAGLRYDLQKFAQPPVRNPDPQLAAAGIDTSVLNTDTNNWGPRLGSPGARSARRYVVRGGYGLFYGRTPSIMVGTAHSNNGINVQTITFSGGRRSRADLSADRFARSRTGVDAAEADDLHLRPRLPERAARSRRARRSSTEWIAEHVASRSTTCSSRATTCRARPTSTSAPQRRSPSRSPDGRERCRTTSFAPGPVHRLRAHHLVPEHGGVALQRHDGRAESPVRAADCQSRVAYTLGKVEDTVPDATAVVPEGSDDRKFASNPADFDADRAPGNNDQRHRFVGSVVYTTDTFAARFGGWVEDLLKDWTLSAIYTAQSGQPYSAYVATTSTATPTASTTSRRARRATSSGIPSRSRSTRASRATSVSAARGS